MIPTRHPFTLCALALTLLVAGCASAPSSPSVVAPDAAAVAVPKPSARPKAKAAPVTSTTDAALSAITTETATTAPVVYLSAPADIWERIRRGYAMPDLDNELVRDREQWYATRPDYIQRMTERSERYLFHIVEEIERRNMPMELALLPFIESAFNPQAVSSVKAAGMWQFMPATGQSFDLKQNVFRDDRRDVLASTRAALDYLQQLHDRFGDWHLALAAYNWGQGNVNRALTRNQKAGLPTAYTDLTMPLETRQYVPKLQAVKNIVARPEAFGTQLPPIGNRPFFDTITLQRDMDVAVIASLAGVSEKDFRALNPSIKQPVVMASGTPNILLPWDNAVDFQRQLQSHKGQLASWTAWIVPSTMTAAQAADRVGMSESELRSVNNIPPRMLVRAGSSLLVPRSEHRDADVPEHVADNGQLSLQPEIILKRTTVKARKGDNLARLASRYGVNAVSAAGWNKLAINARLKPGQRVTLMLPQRVALASAKPSRKAGKTRIEARQSHRAVKATSAGAGKKGQTEAVIARAAVKGKKTARQAPAKKSAQLAKTPITKKARGDTKVALDSKTAKKR
ncbi:transglycosylase SLT domain-containing protein [Hydrogenophaga sp.]|uniref:transglycosylase SLT domain-containing protein n=1 Tax=Hydrogenophaga sp. TaxID=1904254 RepID=UPI00286DE223|nr:transglycosylase SLT domain-containing protein [Hydrogenophaga sp.]